MKTQILNGNETVVNNETEKAFLIRMAGDSLAYNGGFKSFDVWVPKSIVKNETIPAWFMENKRKEQGVSNIWILSVAKQKGF
jgi:hypothetical protein